MKVLFVVVSLFILFSNSYSQIIPLPVNNPNLLKVYVINNGMYRLTKADFESSGINTASIDPRTIKLINKGNQLPIHFEGQSNGVFDETDFMDFYGERNYGGNQTYYNGLFAIAYQKEQYLNFYSDTNIYWITWGGDFGLRYNTSPLGSSIQYEFPYHYKEVHFERDLTYSLGENLSSTDYRMFMNDLLQGEGWFWQRFQFNNTILQTYTFNDMYTDTPVPAKMSIWAYPGNQNTGITNEHRFAFLINNSPVDTVRSNNLTRMDTTIEFNSSLLNTGGGVDFVFRYRPPTNFTSGIMFFDYFKIFYPKQFKFVSDSISFSTQGLANDTTSKIFRIAGFNDANQVNIYDVKNGYRIENYSQSGDTLIFTAKGNGKFEVVNNVITKKPMRMKQRVLPDLNSPSNGADYLIVYNKLFASEAEQLRLHRENFDGFRSVKTEIEDIYDVFNYGLEDPVAVRKFVEKVYNDWTAPKVKYVCLFGRGSLDPKKNVATSFYQNFVPVYGNPPTDGYFVNFKQGTLSYLHTLSVGRIPVYTNSEAQIIVNKIIEHDTRPLAEWDKKFAFVTGGFTPSEQNQFRNQSNAFINNWVTSNPLRNEAATVYRLDSAGYQSFNYQDSILSTLNQGAAILNYIGHAATNFWDNGIEEPSIVTNYDRKNIIFSFTCFTGKNAEYNQRSFGEKFMFLPDRGAVSFVGSTGWSFVISGNNFNNFMFRSISQNGLRAMGDIVKQAGFYMRNDTSSFSVRNMVNCYNLIGDPAMKLKIPTHPEFELNENSPSLSNNYPTIKEPFDVNIDALNLGINADSCKFRFILKKNGVAVSQKDTVIYAFGFRKRITKSYTIDSLGHYSMLVQADPNNWYPLDNPSNNTIEFPIQLINFSYIPLKPLDNEIVRRDSVEFVGLNPMLDTISKHSKVILQIDTSRTFSSPVRQTYFREGIASTSTKFITTLPILDSNLIYYWRMNAIIDNDSSGWSPVRRLTYNPQVNPKLDYRDQYSMGSRGMVLPFSMRAQDSIVTIKKDKPGNYNQQELKGLQYNSKSNGLVLTEFEGKIFARSYGGNYWDASYFTVNNKEFYLINGNFWGYNFAKLRKTDGEILQVKNFAMTDASSNDSIVNFLNTFGPSHILVVVKSYPRNNNLIQEPARQKLRDMGSTQIDNIINSFDKWCMISIPVDSGYQVSEGYSSQSSQGWVPVEREVTLAQRSVNGTVTGIYGPAERWGHFSWNREIQNLEKVDFDVIGINRAGLEDTLFTNLNTFKSVDLTAISSRTYPYLKLIGKVKADTTQITSAPVLNNISLTFQPAPEFTLNHFKWVGGDTIFQYGDYTTKVNVAFENLGYSNMHGALFGWSTVIRGEKVQLNYDTVDFVIGKDSIYKANIKFKIYFEEIGPIIPDYLPLTLTVTSLNDQNEFYTYNNVMFNNVKIKNEEPPEPLIVQLNGRDLVNGDLVHLDSEILSKLKNPMVTGDTSLVKVFLNGEYQPYYVGSMLNTNVSSLELTSSNNEYSFSMRPPFTDGENQLSYIYRSTGFGDYDTVTYNVFVDNEFRIENLYNYPNPMRGETRFMFEMNGVHEVSSGIIRIYTVSGRMIKKIDIMNFINGVNEIEWDGRDEDGDFLANGTYLYRLSLSGEKNLELPVQKLVVLR